MNKYDKKYDYIRHNLIKTRFTCELNNLKEKKSEDNSDEDKERMDNLSQIIQAHDDKSKKTKTDIYTDFEKFEYKKKWFRIRKVYKIKKIKEFIEENFVEDVQDEIYNILIDLLNNTKKLNTKLAVEYDMDKEKIISMPIMKKEKELKKFI
uniref:Uncharacterized protein n=1 Tax=Mimivirus LCMiAC02 TaxID=2506609 RepID=A0A481Z0P2_9VIRU|nr:MAG: hypothetical protein LCMiAC02_01650 [Mimivirus LCMiAC02]